MQKLVSRSSFARKAGVNPSSVTRLCETRLKVTLTGKRIDVAHPAAIEYLAERDRAQIPSAATGLDPYYEAAITACTNSGNWSASFLKRELKIGSTRAAKLAKLLNAAEVVPSDPWPQMPPTSTPRGQLVVKEQKKQRGSAAPIEIPDDIQTFLDYTLRELIEKFGTDIRFVDWLSATQKIEGINEKRLKNAATKGDLISRRLVKVGVIDIFNSAHLRLLKDGAKTIAAGVISKQATGAELSEVEAFVSDILGSFIKPIKSKINRALKDV